MEVPELAVDPKQRLTLWEFYRQEELKQREEQSKVEPPQAPREPAD